MKTTLHMLKHLDSDNGRMVIIVVGLRGVSLDIDFQQCYLKVVRVAFRCCPIANRFEEKILSCPVPCDSIFSSCIFLV